MMSEPTLSIVIVNWNTRDLLDQCLASLGEAVGEVSCEIYVVDNGSTDGSTAMVRERHGHVQLLDTGENLGFTGGNNLAFENVRGEYVLMLNPDTICPAGSLAQLVDFARCRPQLGAVGPTLTELDGTPTITYGCFPREIYHLLELLGSHRRRRPRSWRRHSFTKIPLWEAVSSRVDYVAGACMLIPRAVLTKIGSLDDRFFMYFEETDWSLRAKKAGFEIWHDADTAVVHLEGRAAARVSRFSLTQFHKSYRLFVAKNYGPRRVLGFRLALFIENGAKAAVRGLMTLLITKDRASNAALASNFFFVAKLQLRRAIEVTPPSQP